MSTEETETKMPKLTEEDFDDSTIDRLQAEIENRASGKGDWKFDSEAWRTMPAFMDEITEKDVAENEQCAAMAALVYDNLTPHEIALSRKDVGNENMQHALKADAINPANHARAAVRAYTAGLEEGCDDLELNAKLYCNRSMGNFIMENFGKGLADAQRAILMDPTYVKAYNRAAKSAIRIRKWAIAKSMITAGVKLITEKNEETGEETVTDESVQKDFDNLAAQVQKGEDADNAAGKKERLKVRTAAAKTNNLIKEITTRGIKISPKPEITSEQWAQYGNKKPYFDQEGVFHIPILLMYDEMSQTDFLQDVPCDVTMAEVLEQEIMPFPWDASEGRYARLDQFICAFLIDDRVNMPKYYEIPMDWTLFEVMRQKEYIMPSFVPTFHIVAKGSEWLKRWNLEK